MSSKTLIISAIWAMALPICASAQQAKAGSDTLKTARFAEPQMIQAAGKPVRVESPGYAAPAVYDVDGDGNHDLVVGQFKDGKMMVYPGLGQGKFGVGKWLQADGKTAEVPGVW